MRHIILRPAMSVYTWKRANCVFLCQLNAHCIVKRKGKHAKRKGRFKIFNCFLYQEE